MRLLSLSLKNYRKFKKVYVEFVDGLTGIVGLNGVGKSSLVEAVAWTLYGNYASRTIKEQIRSVGSKGVCEAELQIIHHPHHIKVKRSVEEGGATTAELFVNESLFASSVKGVEEAVQKLLQMDWQTFMVSFYAKQRELNALADLTPSARKELLVRMLRIICIDKAVEFLKEDLRQMRIECKVDAESLQKKEQIMEEKRECKEAMKELEENVRNVEESLKKEEEKLSRYIEEFTSSKEKKSLYEKLKTEYRLKEHSLKECSKNMEYLHQQLEEAQREKAKVAELEQKVKELQSLKEEDRRLSEALSQIKIREELFVHLQRVEEQIKRLEEEEEEAEKKMQEQKVLEEKLKKCEERVEKTQEEMQKMKSSLNILLTKREQLAKEYKELLSHIEKMGKMGKDSICPFCKRRLGEDFESIKEHVHKELERVEREGRGVREKIDRTKAALLKEERICSFLQRKKEEWVQALKRMEGAEKIWNEKRRQREEVSLQRMQILERMSSFEHILYDEKMHQSVRRKIEDLERVAKEVERARAKLEMENKLKEKALEEERRMEQLKEGMDEVKERLEQIEFDEEKFSELERRVEEERESVSLHKEELYKLFAQKASLEKQMQMLQEEMEHIESVAQRLREKEEGVQKLEKLQQIFVDFRMHLISRIRPRLEEIASTFFCSITQGKYQGIKIDEEYQMYIIDGGVAYPLHRFSGGEIDLASLCLRLAISSLLLQAQGVDAGFMILDEIFGSQDIQRRTQIMDALVQLQGFFRQLLLITHIEDVKENVDNLLFVFEDEEGVSHVKVENNFGRRFG